MKEKIVGIILAFIIGFIGMELYRERQHECPQPPFQSVTDKQQELADLGYDIAVDGKLGPETQQAWDTEWDKRNFSNKAFE